MAHPVHALVAGHGVSRVARDGGDTGSSGDETPLAGAMQIAREGKDVSIFTYSRMRYTCLQAANELAKEGIDCEVRPSPQGRH